ncbi:hypothetical protein [Nocardia wallacei]|uniref:hypothetical protein n=1 Tax=Nocardia wallacei TaxID=480035 RepID=UPI002457ED7C|nr:hypothetical protein [Nocardia wallacei]
MTLRRRRIVNGDPTWLRVRVVSERATRGGYHLVRDTAPPYRWLLLDIEDGECLYSALTLDEIEQWLNE